MITMSQPHLSPTRRLIPWGALLAALSLLDLTLTAIALNGITGAAELNPLASHAFADSFLSATFYKLVGLELVLILSLLLARAGWGRAVETTLAAWCGVYLLLNAYSLILILGGA